MNVNIVYIGGQVNLSIEAEASVQIKATLLFFDLIGLAILGISLYEWLLGLLIMGILWTLLFASLTLWNFYGKETITITKNALTYQQHYGFYKTNVEHKPIYRALNISLIPVANKLNQPHYQLIFESYNAQQLPEEIYRSSLAISASDLECLKQNIRLLYFKKIEPDFISQPYLLN
ncbi:hypothetical protein [Pedobacter sp.]|uniref:hypothetical protein n=1 Tax=Pedobacter sp. TaxID=1411316 RepID=UPI003D7F9947